jgi:hypothetical protein
MTKPTCPDTPERDPFARKGDPTRRYDIALLSSTPVIGVYADLSHSAALEELFGLLDAAKYLSDKMINAPSSSRLATISLYLLQIAGAIVSALQDEVKK